jgi:TonB family protein
MKTKLLAASGIIVMALAAGHYPGGASKDASEQQPEAAAISTEKINQTPVSKSAEAKNCGHMSNSKELALEHLHSAKTLLSKENWRQALLELDKSSQYNPNDSSCWGLMGACYMQIGKFDEAKEAYQKATKLSTGHDYIPGPGLEKFFPPNDLSTTQQVKPEDAEFRQRYMADLQRLIKRNWHPDSTHLTDSVVVAFKISREGKLSCARVHKSSGNVAFDKAAVDAVNDTPKIGAFPAEWGKEIDACITFDNATLMSQ